MIEKIFARNFKGLSFDQEISQYTLFVGPNGVGKSARCQALTIAVLEYLPADQKKQPGAIYAIHATGEEMIVGFETGGSRLTRKYRPTSEGASLETSLNGKKLTAKLVTRTLMDLGNPRIFDIREFTELSEQEKINFFLALSPPSGDLRKVNLAMYEADEKEKKLRGAARAKEGIIEQLTAEKAALKLPAGTLAELQEEIKQKSMDLEKARQDLKDAELAEQQRKDAAEAERKRLEDLEKEKEKTLEALTKGKEEGKAEAKQEMADVVQRAETAQADLKKLQEHIGKRERAVNQMVAEALKKGIRPDARAICFESLQKVRETMIETGCELCAGLIVLNLEIQKFEPEEGTHGNGTSAGTD